MRAQGTAHVHCGEDVSDLLLSYAHRTGPRMEHNSWHPTSYWCYQLLDPKINYLRGLGTRLEAKHTDLTDRSVRHLMGTFNTTPYYLWAYLCRGDESMIRYDRRQYRPFYMYMSGLTVRSRSTPLTHLHSACQWSAARGDTTRTHAQCMNT